MLMIGNVRKKAQGAGHEAWGTEFKAKIKLPSLVPSFRPSSPLFHKHNLGNSGF
jgi:hypothetical protein